MDSPTSRKTSRPHKPSTRRSCYLTDRPASRALWSMGVSVTCWRTAGVSVNKCSHWIKCRANSRTSADPKKRCAAMTWKSLSSRQSAALWAISVEPLPHGNPAKTGTNNSSFNHAHQAGRITSGFLAFEDFEPRDTFPGWAEAEGLSTEWLSTMGCFEKPMLCNQGFQHTGKADAATNRESRVCQSLIV